MPVRAGVKWWIYNKLTSVRWLRQLHEQLLRYAIARNFVVVAIAIITVLALSVNPWVIRAVQTTLVLMALIGVLFAAWDFGLRWSDTQIGQAKRDSAFDKVLRKPLEPTEGWLAETSRTRENLQLAAQLEHEAFSIYGNTSESVRVDRLARWSSLCPNCIFFIAQHGEIVGYSVIIPVSEMDAQRYREGLMKEFGFVPDVSDNRPTLFYAQALFLKREFQGRNECLGLAQRAFLTHLGSFFPDGTFQPFCVLADSETLDGARFLCNLGFEKGPKSANGRPIWELDLRQPQRLNDYGRYFGDIFTEILSASQEAVGRA